MLKHKLIILILLAVFNREYSGAQTNQLKLEDIYKNNIYGSAGYGPVRWMNDNKTYSTLEKNEKTGGRDIVSYDAANGTRKILVSAGQLIPPGSEKPLGISDYIWSDDNAKLLIFTNTKRVWRYNTKGDYWVLNLASGKLKQLGKNLEGSSLMFAKFSPDASRTAYVSKQNIYAEDIESGNITQITKDGGDNIINGTFDWVYEEELDCRDGFRWSPDGKTIAYWQSDTKGVGTFYMINNTDSIYSKPIPLPYPKVGTSNSAVKIGIVPAIGGSTKWFEIPGDPRNNYLARMNFIPASNEVMVQQLNRLQNSNAIWIGNIETMQLNNIYTEKDDAYLDLHDDIEWLDNNKSFTWTSEKDGWLHLYRLSRNGKEMSLITKGNFDVVQVSCIDIKGGYLYYIASPDNFTQRYLYRSRLDGKGITESVTPAGLPGHHGYQISPDAKFAIHTYENANTPRKIDLINLTNHKQIRILQDNSGLVKKYGELGLRSKEFYRIDIGEVVLDAWMIKPIDFDSTKKYPVIFHVYGEPAGSTVQDNWNTGDNWWHQYMAQQGYIIMSVDNRGTNVFRGREFRKCIYRQIGILAAEDQAKAAKKIFEMLPFIDSQRVGIWGWSGGGSMTLDCMFRYPEIYKTGISIAFVANQLLYDNIYQERYMGLPDNNADGYREGSPVTHAGKLQGNLLLVHGTNDDNVHYQNFEILVNELIKQNKMFNIMSYPNRSHGIYEGENTSFHLRQTMEKYWKANLVPGGK